MYMLRQIVPEGILLQQETLLQAVAQQSHLLLLCSLQLASAANMSGRITIQKTGVSDTDPLPGHSAHQLVMAIPPRSDGKVWVGIVTWTASKPVEVVVLHGYNSSVTADAAHGQPLTAPFGKGSVAISLVKTPSGTPVASGSIPFVGNAIAFHTLNGDKFIVTYSADATAKDLTK